MLSELLLFLYLINCAISINCSDINGVCASECGRNHAVIYSQHVDGCDNGESCCLTGNYINCTNSIDQKFAKCMKSSDCTANKNVTPIEGFCDNNSNICCVGHNRTSNDNKSCVKPLSFWKNNYMKCHGYTAHICNYTIDYIVGGRAKIGKYYDLLIQSAIANLNRKCLDSTHNNNIDLTIEYGYEITEKSCNSKYEGDPDISFTQEALKRLVLYNNGLYGAKHCLD